MPKQQTDASRMGRAWRTSAAAAGVIAIIFAVMWPSCMRAGDHAFIVATAQTIWEKGVDLKAVDCLTLNRKIGNHIYGTDFSDDPNILEMLRGYFPNKAISSNGSSCRYVFSFVILVADTHAVRYAGHISRIMMAFSVIEKNPASGSLYWEGVRFKGDYKNLYQFRSDLKPLDAFEVGLKAFTTPQAKEWDVMRISVPVT
jgi:hypothetical protein